MVIRLRLDALRAHAFQIVDDCLGMNLLLDVDRHGIDAKIRAILGILALPDELRVEVRVAGIAQRDRSRLVLADQPLRLGRRNVLPRVRRMGQRLDGEGGFHAAAPFSCVSRSRHVLYAACCCFSIARCARIACAASYCSVNSRKLQRPKPPWLFTAGTHRRFIVSAFAAASRPR